jgi:transposase
MEHLRPNPDNGILALENNVAERGMRAVVFGRKNHLVVGSAAGGTAAAVAYSLSETG